MSGLSITVISGEDEVLIGARDISAYVTTTNAAGAVVNLTQTTQFRVAGDWKTRKAHAARLLWQNLTGATAYVWLAVMNGKPVNIIKRHLRYERADNDDIAKSGKKELTVENPDIAFGTSAARICDYLYKKNRRQAHLYSLTLKGTRYWVTPGEWYTLQVGGAGETEYIDSVVECVSVNIDRGVGTIGATNVVFREMYQNWTFDSTEQMRTYARSNPNANINRQTSIFVAAAGYQGEADFHCTGANDHIVINTAILASEYTGRRQVVLSNGTFNLAGYVSMRTGVSVIGQGTGTRLIKNCNDYGVAFGQIENAKLENVYVSRDAADTNAKPLIYMEASSRCVVQGVTVYNSYAEGMFARSTTACAVKGCYFDSNGQNTSEDQGLEFEDSTGSVVDGNYFVDSASADIFIQKLSAASVDAVITNNRCVSSTYGIYIDKGSDVVVSGNSCSGHTGHGISVINGSRCSVNNNVSVNNSLSGIYISSGTDITVAGNNCNSNTQHGIVFLYGLRCVANNNITAGNTESGIWLSASRNISATGNSSYDNVASGIIAGAVRDCNINSNNVMANGGYGIRVDFLSRHVVIVGNRVKNNVLGNISNAGINSTVASNDETGTVARAGLLTETAYIFEPTIVV